MEPVKKPHPRRAVWWGRVVEFGPQGVCGVAAVFNVFAGSIAAALAWLFGLAALLAYQWRVQYAWRWGWEKGKQAALDGTLPLVRLDEQDSAERLRAVFMAEAPTWRKTQDELVQVDHEATMQEVMERFERARGS